MAKLAYPVHQQPARVTWGTGSVRALTEAPFGPDTVVFTTGQASVVATLDAALLKRGVRLGDATVIAKPGGEPTAAMIEWAAEQLRAVPATRIIGFGGGSVLDWCRLSVAKAVGGLDMETGRVADPQGLAARPPLWLVPTTCATGAEAAGVAVFMNRDGRKLPVVSPAFVADHVVLDGQFLAGLEASTLATFLGDALTHAVEAFVSIVPGTLAKEAAVSAARLVLTHANASATPSRNERLMEAGFLGGVAASNCSVGVVHAFAHTVAKWGVPHGYANALALDAGILANSAVPAMTTLAERLGQTSVANMRAAIAAVLAPAEAHAADATLRSALASAGTRAEIVEGMAGDVCLRTNPQRLSADELASFVSAVSHRIGSSQRPDAERVS